MTSAVRFGGCGRTAWLALALLSLGGCNRSSGAFDGVPFVPLSTTFAVADRHDLVRVGSGLQASLKPESQRTLTLLFTGARVSERIEWRRLRASDLLELRRALATEDGLLLTGLSIAEAVAGARFQYRPLTDEEAPFEIALVTRADPFAEIDQSYGTDIEYTLTIDDVTPEAGGTIVGSLDIQRSRGPGQGDGEVATGEVTLTFALPVVAERRGKSNLSLAIPIMRCAAQAGATRAAACRDAPPLEFLDATGVVTGG